MIIDWDLKTVKAQVDRISWAESDPRMDGFVTWRCKEDLYQLYWYIEDKLASCSTYGDTEEKLLGQRKERKVIKKLGGYVEDQ